MEERMYTQGVSFGMESYSQQRAIVGTFGTATLTGYLSYAACDSDFARGALHGLALGANLHAKAQDATIKAWA
jgi:hypothetical protein